MAKKPPLNERQAIIVGPGEVRTFVGGLICRVSSESTCGNYCAFEVVTPPGEGVPLHVHIREDEVYYILEGAYEIQCGGEVFRAEAGAMAVLPRNVPHAFRNPGKTPARALTMFIPGGFDEFVQELNDLLPDASNEAKRTEIRRKYGIQMLHESNA
jgi:mannose-6-phosphate isomerase-like protein (cupin superfamily)